MANLSRVAAINAAIAASPTASRGFVAAPSAGGSASGTMSNPKDAPGYVPGSSATDSTATRAQYAANPNYLNAPTQQIPTNTDTSQQVNTPETAPNQAQVNTPNQQMDLANAVAGKGSALTSEEMSNQQTLTKYANQYKQGLAVAKTSNLPAPTSQGQFGVATQGMTLGQESNDGTSAVQSWYSLAPESEDIMATYDEIMSPQNQKTSLLDEYNQLSQFLGIQGLNAELINEKNIIDGTEDDIRNEITAAGGFGTDSQVLAMANARNKSLIKNYNALLDTRNNATQQLETMMNLSMQDRQLAAADIDRKMNYAFKVAEFKQQAVNNARTTYLSLGENMGWDTLLTSVSPYEQGVIQKTLGLSSGMLSQMASASAQKRVNTQQENALDMAIKQQQLYNLQLTGRKSEQELGIGTPKPADILSLSKAQGDVQSIESLAQSSAIDSVVGTSLLSRATTGIWNRIKQVGGATLAGMGIGAAAGAPFAGVGAIPGAVLGGAAGLVGGLGLASQGVSDELSGERQTFVAGVEQMRSQLNLDTLIQAKSQGATFGALSDNELQVLASAATKIGTWAIKDDKGKILGYDVSEKQFRKELDTINYYAKLDYILKGGTPADVGAVVKPDNTVWVRNSDGTLSQLR